MSDSTEPTTMWFGPRTNTTAMMAFGLRLAGGGTHQSKTMMFHEIEALLALGFSDASEIKRVVVDENILGKATANTRTLTYRHLVSLYALNQNASLFQVLSALWKIDLAGRRLLALLAALARDPLLRDTAAPIIGAAIGEPLERARFEAALMEAHPERFSEKMVRSLAQNCASTWTQAGQLEGKVRKIRRTRYAHTASRCLRGSVGDRQRLWRTGNSQFPVVESPRSFSGSCTRLIAAGGRPGTGARQIRWRCHRNIRPAAYCASFGGSQD